METSTSVHQSVYHALPTQKISNAKVKKLFVISVTGSSLAKRCFKNHLKNRSKIEGKTDIVCDTAMTVRELLQVST